MKPRRPSLRARHPAEAAWEPRIAAVEELDHLRGLVDDLDAIAWEAIAATGDFTLVSGGATTIVGYPPEEWLSSPGFWVAHIHPDDRERTLAEFRAASAVPGALHELEYRFLGREGRVIWLRQVGHVVTDASDGPTLVRGLMFDVTSRKVIEEQHREAEARYRALVEQLPAIVYTEPIDGGSERATANGYVSPRAREMLGIAPDEWMADPAAWLDAIHPDDRERVIDLDREADRTLEPFIAEYRILARDGRTLWIHDEAAVLYDDEGTPVQWQGVMIDITDQRRAVELERDLGVERATAQRLREVDELKNTLLQAVSHDLRTPLAAILGLAVTLARDDLDLEVSEVRDLGSRIAANARKLDRLVGDLLDLDRLSRGIVEPVPAPTDLAGLVLRILEESGVARERALATDVRPVTIAVDRAMVERIVENLVSNSLKHAPRADRLWIRVGPHEGGALLEVEDDGPGIPEALRSHVFEPFRRGPADEATPGVGIGLSLVRRFAEIHGGRAWVEDRPGGGASFKVYLPDRSGLPDAPRPDDAD